MMNPYDVVRDFERTIAEFADAPYAVAVESCSSAIFLCCLFCKVKDINEVIIPKFTYPSVAASIVNAGGRVAFRDIDWQKKGYYKLGNTEIVDSAKCLSVNMYEKGQFACLSFHGKKLLPIGRGGMILTDSLRAFKWLKIARFDGRHECNLTSDKLMMAGWNMYLTPGQAARGLELFQWLPDKNISNPDPYQDLSKYEFFTKANR